MRRLRGDSGFRTEFEQMKELYGKTMTLARSVQTSDKNWSLPLGGDSIEKKIWLEFRLEKWIEIPF